MYTLKSIARRGTSFTAAMALVVSSVGSAVLPAMSAYADALNPLTERSLTLSSSSPGWSFKDGSDNSTYAPPNSGANGQKAGNYYDFKVSTDSTNGVGGTGQPIKAFTFQYCTTAAGGCLSPGNDGWTGTDPAATRNADDIPGHKTDLNVTVGTSGDAPLEIAGANFGTVVDTATGAIKAVPGFKSGVTGRESAVTGAAEAVSGNYVVYYESAPGTWTQSTGWVMTAGNQETGTVTAGTATGKNNLITLKKTAGEGLKSGTRVKVLFFANENNYITNPGEKEFFVRINTYKDDTALTNANIIDGGVTVANIMNQSIWIQTKVLETMDFSVGTVNPDTLSPVQLAASENSYSDGTGAAPRTGICDRILTRMTSADNENVLKMGDPVGEYSLRTDTTFSTHSYWRLSSNSSAGATVYYSGNTLTNTSGDTINAIGATKTAPTVGAEQFGLALANGARTVPDVNTGPYNVNYSAENTAGKVYESGADDAAAGLVAGTGVHSSWTAITNVSKHDNRLIPLVPAVDYDQGTGVINTGYGAIDTAFAFDSHSNEVPVPIATENNQVVDCVTGKMRYVANIAATTPAGIYTTKVNYIASPQY